MKRRFFPAIALMWLGLGQIQLVQATEQAVENKQNIAKNEPLFKDGKGYYSYKKPLSIELPKDGRVLIQYFFKYECAVCLTGDDSLKQYAKRNQDKVVLQRSPSFEKNETYTARMHFAFEKYGRPDLSDLYLFDSVGRKAAQSLVKNNDAIIHWLNQHGVDVLRLKEIIKSPEMDKHLLAAYQHYQIYSPPFTPIAVLNGKYILIANTLYNDDYTYAVLDFLVDKLKQEQQEDKK